MLLRGLALEDVTLGWNVVGSMILLVSAATVGSIALAGFGIDSLIEIVASAVVVWQLKGEDESRRERGALRIIAIAFLLLAIYIAVQIIVTLSSHSHPGHSALGMAWLAATVVAMFALAAAKRDTGQRLGNPVLQTEAGVTLIDGALAAAVLAGVVERRPWLVVGRPALGARHPLLRPSRGTACVACRFLARSSRASAHMNKDGAVPP